LKARRQYRNNPSIQLVFGVEVQRPKANPVIVFRPQSKTQKKRCKASAANVNDDWTLLI